MYTYKSILSNNLCCFSWSYFKLLDDLEFPFSVLLCCIKYTIYALFYSVKDFPVRFEFSRPITTVMFADCHITHKKIRINYKLLSND